MKAASIDIGTNSVLLLVCEKENGSLRVLHEGQAVPRLGRGVDREKNLHPESRHRVISVLEQYRDLLQRDYPGVLEHVIVTATSAVRDAANRDQFMEEVKQATGWSIRLLSGEEEAQTTFRGALSVLENRGSCGNLILDIGGGSTEIAFGQGYRLLNGISVDMGSVRFTERFVNSDPPGASQVLAIQEAIKAELKNVQLPVSDFETIGVAGTITSIAAIHKKMETCDASALNGARLHRGQIAQSIQEFSVTKSADLEKKYPRFLTGRGEVILAGALILDEFLSWCKKDEIIVSAGGIRHGVLLEK